MDTSSLNFHYEERFSDFESTNFMNTESIISSMESVFAVENNPWEWEVEREYNGDIALIPMSSGIDMNYSSESPPIRGDFQNLLSEVHFEVPDMETFTESMPLCVEEEHHAVIADEPAQISMPSLDVPLSPTSFDLLEYTNSENIAVNDTNLEVSLESVASIFEDIKPNIIFNRSTGKKIDMNAQCYIVEDNQTIAPKLELSDSSDDEGEFLTPKLEEIDIVKEEIPQNYSEEYQLDADTSEQDMELEPTDHEKDNAGSESEYVDVDTISEQGTPILQAGDLNSLLEQFEATENSHYFDTTETKQSPAEAMPRLEAAFEKSSDHHKALSLIGMNESNLISLIKSEETEFQQNSATEPVPSVSKASSSSITEKPKQASEAKDDFELMLLDTSKQILNALPEELIKRIKASSKRRVVPVIDPIPTKRRGTKRAAQVEVQQTPPQIVQVKEQKQNSDFVKLDHDYCTHATPYPKHPKKDSGFESAEEDEQRNILRNQPTVKGADGKLMVSLLKVNTIRSNTTTNAEPSKKKRKLNLEEYKKRHEGVFRSRDNSQSNSPINSGRNSPVCVVEDERVRVLKHQQKLDQMKAEVLNTPPKHALTNVATTSTAAVKLPPILPPKSENLTGPPPPRVPPENMERRDVVSIGVNTIITYHNRLPEKVLEDPAIELEEFKPILQNASAKISNNSLITCVIENVKQKRKLQKKSTEMRNNISAQLTEQEHRENRVITFLDKFRPVAKTRSVEVQTEDIAETKTKRKRRRSSSSTSSHRKSYKRRSDSSDSRYSHSSCSSRSRSSRSPSPHQRRIYNRKRLTDPNYIKEVEERRIIFVGGLSRSVTPKDLLRRFEQFGPIYKATIHTKEIGDNFGFVTFEYKEDAYAAVEHGNDDRSLPQYDISFGGRRLFCGSGYSDLDSVNDNFDMASQHNGLTSQHANISFDTLLRKAQEDTLLRRKTVYT